VLAWLEATSTGYGKVGYYLRLGRECFRGPNQKCGKISQDGYYQGQEKKEGNSKETFDRCVALELLSVRGCYR